MLVLPTSIGLAIGILCDQNPPLKLIEDDNKLMFIASLEAYTKYIYPGTLHHHFFYI